jgi:hypothetical protein
MKRKTCWKVLFGSQILGAARRVLPQGDRNICWTGLRLHRAQCHSYCCLRLAILDAESRYQQELGTCWKVLFGSPILGAARRVLPLYCFELAILGRRINQVGSVIKETATFAGRASDYFERSAIRIVVYG